MPGYDYTRTLTSFSGADIVVSIGKTVVGELQQITWAIQRQKVPVYTLGSPDPRSFSRGKRGVAGSLIFAVFDRDAMIEAIKENWELIAPPAMFTAKGNVSQLASTSSDLFSALEMSEWNKKAAEGFPFNVQQTNLAGKTEDVTRNGVNYQIYVPPGFDTIKPENIIYADMIPPFIN